MIRALITAGQLGAILHGDDLVKGLAKFGAKLALKARRANVDAGEEMVELMRSRVPVDSGRLLNGITLTEDEAGNVIVEASAVRGDFDYARVVEFGRDDMEAEPFFLTSAEDVLEERRRSVDDAIGDAAEESGL